VRVMFGGTFVPDRSTGSSRRSGWSRIRPRPGGAGGPSNTNGFSDFSRGLAARAVRGSVTLVASGDHPRAYRVRMRCRSAGWRRRRRYIRSMWPKSASAAPAATVVAAARPRCSG
jgi:hypothetical protein